MLGSMANESTGTGVAELDRALDGLYWGDNVVWVWEGSEPHQQLFYDAIAQRRDDFGAVGYVAASTDPAEITERWPWIEILDARPGTPITSPRQLLDAIHQFCAGAPRPLLLFDSLAPLADRWGMRIASGFFGHCCPMLLDLGAIAYWSVPGARQYRTMHREIEQAVPLLRQGWAAATAAGPGSGARRCGVARLPLAPGSEPERSRTPRRGLPQRHLPGGAG
jgi:hypothetical protein